MKNQTALFLALVLSGAATAQTTAAQTSTTQTTAAQTATPRTGMPMTTQSGSRTGTGKSSMPMTMHAPLNVNTATAQQLSSVRGLGAALVADIVKHRPYKNRADLIKRVKGIGPKNYVTLGLDKVLTY